MSLLRRLSFRRALVCRQAVELVTDYLEGALSPADRARFEAHLAQCPHCTAYFEQMRATIASLGRIDPAELEPEVQDDLIALFRRWSTAK
jgi:anti-sigma factor RsiW